MTSDSDSAITCQICLDDFNETERRPLTLDGCGHCFCKRCLGSMNHICPVCRTVYINLLPNFLVLQMLQSSSRFGEVNKTNNCIRKTEKKFSNQRLAKCAKYDGLRSDLNICYERELIRLNEMRKKSLEEIDAAAEEELSFYNSYSEIFTTKFNQIAKIKEQLAKEDFSNMDLTTITNEINELRVWDEEANKALADNQEGDFIEIIDCKVVITKTSENDQASMTPRSSNSNGRKKSKTPNVALNSDISQLADRVVKKLEIKLTQNLTEQKQPPAQHIFAVPQIHLPPAPPTNNNTKTSKIATFLTSCNYMQPTAASNIKQTRYSTRLSSKADQAPVATGPTTRLARSNSERLTALNRPKVATVNNENGQY